MRDARLGGVTLQVDDEQPTFWERAEAGRWEPGTLAALGGLVGPGTMVLDIGAWVGPLSLFAAARGAQVLALEPDPVAAAQFRRNVAANPSLAPRIVLIEAALSSGPEPVRLGARRKRGDSMSSVLLAEGADSWSAAAITPAELLEQVGRLEGRHTPAPQDLVQDSQRRHPEEAAKRLSRRTHHGRACFETRPPGAPQHDALSVSSFGPGSHSEKGRSTPSVAGGPLVAKIDIEGGEYALLPHLAPLIAAVDALLVSFHPRVLAEAGTSDPAAALWCALVPLAGWIASPIEAEGEGPPGIVPDAPIERPEHETWLFRPPASAALGRPGASR